LFEQRAMGAFPAQLSASWQEPEHCNACIFVEFPSQHQRPCTKGIKPRIFIPNETGLTGFCAKLYIAGTQHTTGNAGKAERIHHHNFTLVLLVCLIFLMSCCTGHGLLPSVLMEPVTPVPDPAAIVPASQPPELCSETLQVRDDACSRCEACG